MKIVYLAGPADTIAAYRASEAGRMSEYFGTSYMVQFFDICRHHRWKCNVISTTSAPYFEKVLGDVTIQNRPPLTGSSAGISFHIRSVVWMLSALISVMRYRPDAVIMTAFQNYWFVFAPLRLMGVKLVLSVHCTLWPPNNRRRTAWRVLWFLNEHLIVRRSSAIFGVSDTVVDQLKTIAGKVTEIRRFFPTYRREQFSGIAPPPAVREPFRVFYAGRIEENKGVFHILEMADRLNRSGSGIYVFDLCGTGSALEALSADITKRQLGQWVTAHGFCDATRMSSLLGASHAVIVPTTGDFEEGFNKVVAEAVLAGRPVITSKACPALPDVYPAAVEARVENIEDYVAAIRKLREDQEFYREKAANCASVQEQFYNPSNSWRSIMEQALVKLDA